MAKIKGNRDGPGGRNDTYTIGSRRSVPRVQAVREVRSGMHPAYHVVVICGVEYIRDNPDHRKSDNVNR